jgi:sugar-specific transcriptional regulator TrmB
MKEGKEGLREDVTTWPMIFDYVKPDIVLEYPTNEIVSTAPATPSNIKRFKMSHTASSSHMKSRIGQQISRLLQEDKK